MDALPVTYSDNASAGAPVLDIDCALFGDASSFIAILDPHIPKFPPSCVSAFVSAADLFTEQSDLISASRGTKTVRPVHSRPPSRPRSLYQCPVIKMSPFNFQAIAFLSAEAPLQ